MIKTILKICLLFICILLTACGKNPINSPEPIHNYEKNIYFSSFSEQPKTLDPARSYNENESVFIAQMYEPPFQYHYLKRPYVLIPLTATKMPIPMYFDKNGKRLPENAPDSQVAKSVYEITIQPHIYYQPHPAFATDVKGNALYLALTPSQIDKISSLKDFTKTGTRELTANDYVYEIKRIADPANQSPIFGLMQEHILGLSELGDQLKSVRDKLSKENSKDVFLNLNQFNFSGAEAVNRYTYRIILKGKYPQFIYWLAMPFFAPVPWEADKFYAQQGMEEKNLTLSWYPVGTGPYMLTENNPNHAMVLSKNPNFHEERYPSEGTAGDREQGLLQNAGKPLPFIDTFHFSLEKESIPRWNKFLEGYYDQSGIASDNFDQTIHIHKNGEMDLSPEMKAKNIKLRMSMSSGLFYLGFNMLDEVVGGYSERAKKLRQAIAIVIDYDEFISIFLNGRGMTAHGPLPPGIFGYEAGKTGMNPYIFEWNKQRLQRKTLKQAKKLLAEAGYPDGHNAKTGKPLLLYLDISMVGGAGDKSQYDWLRKQFDKLGIQLQIRDTQYNQFQEKMRNGNTQMFMWGWQADYPDPENFLFLLYGPNSRAQGGGENVTNYHNPKFDLLFSNMKNMPNSPERLDIIRQMLAIVQDDSPWVWGFIPQDFTLGQSWVAPSKPSMIIRNNLKYIQIDPQKRMAAIRLWNKPIFWPIAIILMILLLIMLPVFIRYWQREHLTVRQKGKF
jgi:oligopeptide transport system substrate-binding protein